MLNFRKYPSTTALKCFETSARHLSFTRAAKELHMTQSAVSKQVAQLEDLLKLSLFNRTSQSLYLTPIGKKYYLEIQKILMQIERSTLDLMAHGVDTQTLKIVAHPTFCARWLVPALKGFGQEHPTIHLDVQELAKPFFNEDYDCDVAFLYGDGVWSGMQAQKIFDEKMVAVCRPDYLKEPLQTLKDIENYVLLQTSTRPSAWYNYFDAQDVGMSGSFIGPRFATFYACISGALTGCGVALVPKIMVQPELDKGELILAWNHIHQGLGAYYMTYANDRASTPRVQAMTAWIDNYLNQTV